MSAALLEVTGLSVSYRRGGEWAAALSGVTLTVGAGDAYGLVGESGCGKSTLALSVVRCLPRNGRIDAGAVRFDGAALRRMDAEALRRIRGAGIAMVSQDPVGALNPTLRIGDQIAEVYRLRQRRGPADALRRARDILARVAVPDPEAVLGRYPHQLSGGQQQRVVIAMALAGHPRLLVLDEPTTGLDATIEAEILELIAALRAELNLAILLISHNLRLVARMCDQIGVMYAGRIVEEGTARDVFSRPHHPYTMGLLRCLPGSETKRNSRLESIPGTPLFLGEPVRGCTFHPRCLLAGERCRAVEPELLDAGPGRRSRCFYWTDVPQMPSAGTPAAPLEPAGGGAPLVDVRGLRKTYRGRGQRIAAVDEVSLVVMRGETFGLVGESGSGKTTLARCLAGLTRPDAGTLTFAGRSLPWPAGRRDRASLGAVQMVFQNPDTTLNPAWTVWGILARAAYVLLGLRGGVRRRRIAELAEQVQLHPGYLGLRAVQLSGGLRQRVAIARAFAGAPALAICDEPTSSLDVSVQAAILNLLMDLQAAEGVSYLFISHDLPVVRYLADRIGVMYLAQLVEVGRTEDVFAGPRHPYTEALLAAASSLDGAAPHPRGPLQGGAPGSAEPPSGCRFHPRCPRRLGAICEQVPPPWQDADGGHLIRCHIPPGELAVLQRPPGGRARPDISSVEDAPRPEAPRRA